MSSTPPYSLMYTSAITRASTPAALSEYGYTGFTWVLKLGTLVTLCWGRYTVCGGEGGGCWISVPVLSMPISFSFGGSGAGSTRGCSLTGADGRSTGGWSA